MSQSVFSEYFDDTHRLLRDAVQRFVGKEILPHIDQWEQQEGFPRELYNKAGEAGFLGIGYPEKWGGSEGDIFQKIVWVEELMAAGAGGLAAGLGSLDIALPPLLGYGSDRLKQHVLPDAIAGRKICALAITEPGGGSDVANLTTRADRVSIDGTDYYKVNGSKTFITSGIHADYYTVAVRTGGEGYGGISLLLIHRDTPGFGRGKPLKKMGWWCSDTAELFFNDCLVPASYLIGTENQGFAMITSNFQQERLVLAVMANRTAELALEASLGHVKQRRAFGQSLSSFQVTRHKLADMATLLEASKSLTYRCASRVEKGESLFKQVSMAKNFATDVSDKITYDAVQLFGGAGYMQGTLVERLYRDNRILSIGGGTREIMNEIICKQLAL